MQKTVEEIEGQSPSSTANAGIDGISETRLVPRTTASAFYGLHISPTPLQPTEIMPPSCPPPRTSTAPPKGRRASLMRR